MNSLIIGSGEVGKSLHTVLRREPTCFIRDVKPVKVPSIDVLHIAFPYSKDFIKSVKNYIEQYDPSLTIVYSSVPIGTCESIGTHIVHSPIEGKHPNLHESIRIMPRWLGAKDKKALRDAGAYWSVFAETVRLVKSSRATEMLKLRSTAKYGINLVWADYEKSLTDSIGAEWDMVKLFDLDYNMLYEQLGFPEYSRYLLDPPGGKIGGHCVRENAILLDAQYPNDLLKMIIAMKGEK